MPWVRRDRCGVLLGSLPTPRARRPAWGTSPSTTWELRPTPFAPSRRPAVMVPTQDPVSVSGNGGSFPPPCGPRSWRTRHGATRSAGACSLTDAQARQPSRGGQRSAIAFSNAAVTSSIGASPRPRTRGSRSSPVVLVAPPPVVSPRLRCRLSRGREAETLLTSRDRAPNPAGRGKPGPRALVTHSHDHQERGRKVGGSALSSGPSREGGPGTAAPAPPRRLSDRSEVTRVRHAPCYDS